MKQTTEGERYIQHEANELVDAYASIDFIEALGNSRKFRCGEGCQCPSCAQRVVEEFNQAADFWYQGKEPCVQLHYFEGKVLTSDELNLIIKDRWGCW